MYFVIVRVFNPLQAMQCMRNPISREFHPNGDFSLLHELLLHMRKRVGDLRNLTNIISKTSFNKDLYM